MFIILTLSVLLLSALTTAALRLTRRPMAFAWLASALGALLAWVSILLWQFDLPQHLAITSWAPEILFNTTPGFKADSYAWLYALSLGTLTAAVILTSPARKTALSPGSWIGTLSLALVALLAIMADNILTLALAWTAIDLLEYLNTLRISKSSALDEQAVILLSFRIVGTGFALWATVVGAASDSLASLGQTPPQAWLFMLLAVGLRLGVIPLHLAYRDDPVLRRGSGLALRLTTAATSLMALAHLPAGGTSKTWLPFLLFLVALTALYTSWKWLSLPEEINARPYWITGVSALSLAAALRGNPAGSAAWGAALVLFGGLSFLYSSRQLWFTRLLAGLSIFFFSLPFTLTASGWLGSFPLPGLFWPMFLASHAMLAAGYVRRLFQTGDTPFEELPRWAQAAYPLGLGIFILTIILTSLWGWPGSLQTGAWVVGLIMAALAGLVGILYLRLRHLFEPSSPAPDSATTAQPVQAGLLSFARLQNSLGALMWGLYRLLGGLLGYVSTLLEGDGGLLWTLLLLIIFITALRGL